MLSSKIHRTAYFHLFMQQSNISRMPPKIKKQRQRRPKELGPHFIKAWRELRRDEYGDEITQGDIQKVTGISQSTLSHVETFKIPYTQPMLEKLAKFHKCHPADLILGKPGQKRSDPASEKALILQTIADISGALSRFGLLHLDEKHRDLLIQLTLAAHELRRDPPRPGTRQRKDPEVPHNDLREEKKLIQPKS